MGKTDQTIAQKFVSRTRQAPPPLMRDLLQKLDPAAQRRARRLVMMLERLAEQKRAATATPPAAARDWEGGLDLAATFLKSAYDARAEKRLARITRGLKQIDPVMAAAVIHHYFQDADPQKPARHSSPAAARRMRR